MSVDKLESHSEDRGEQMESPTKSQTTARRCFTVMWVSFAIFLGAISGEFFGDYPAGWIEWILTVIGYVAFLIAAISMVATLFYWIVRGQ
jgi:hypothetical protein